MYGSDRVLLEDVRGLLQAHWQVSAALPAEGQLSQALRALGAQVVICPTPVLRKAIFTPRGALAFLKDTFQGVRKGRRLLKEVKPAAVLVNTTTIPLWVALARVTGHRVIIHVHESERHSPVPFRLGLSLPGSLANRVITNSRFTNDAYLQLVPWVRKKSQVVLNGIPGPERTTPPRAALTGAVRLLYVGRLSERKGILAAIQAVGLLQEKGITTELSLVGAVFEGYEWFEQKLQEEVSRLPEPERVKFLGFQSDVWPHYEATDIALVPSMLEESFGNTAVEAVLAGRPAVVSSIGGLREAVEPYSSTVLVNPGDPQALAAGIEKIIDHWDNFRENAAESAAQARDRHDPAKFGTQIDEIISQVAAPR